MPYLRGEWCRDQDPNGSLRISCLIFNTYEEGCLRQVGSNCDDPSGWAKISANADALLWVGCSIQSWSNAKSSWTQMGSEPLGGVTIDLGQLIGRVLFTGQCS